MGNITIERYTPEYEDRWNDFVAKAKNGLFLFDRKYMDYHSDRFKDHSLVFMKDGENAALLPAYEQEGKLVSHGGLTYGGLLAGKDMKQHTANECFDALKEYMSASGIDTLMYKPVPHVFHVQPAEEDIYALHRCGAQLVEASASTVLDLDDPLKMPKGRKAQISRARREGVEIRILKEKEDYERFIELENEVLGERHGVKAVHTADELFLLHSRFPQNIHLYGAAHNGEMIAGTVVYEYADAVHTQYMASNKTGRSVGALDLTIAAVIDDYKGAKKWLDFGISTEDHGKVINNGLISQKEGFGGRTNVYTVWKLQMRQSR